MNLDECIPRKWRPEGFVRKTKLSPMAFLDLRRRESIDSEQQAWALASPLEARGDKGLMGFLVESDAAKFLAKVRVAAAAAASLKRSNQTRMDILREAFSSQLCCCSTPGLTYNLLKDVLRRTGWMAPSSEKSRGACRGGV